MSMLAELELELDSLAQFWTLLASGRQPPITKRSTPHSYADE